MSIRVKYEKKLKEVFEKLIMMCRQIEKTIDKSITCLVTQDLDLAREVIEADKEIDRFERDIEGSCLKILLLEHPVASDFREVSAALKMITDLERIGDQARDVASLTVQIGKDKFVKKLEHIPTMALVAKNMVKQSVESYINKDLESARALNKADDELDELFNNVKDNLVELIKKDGSNANQAILLMMIAKYFERIGDHAVNIGEWVEYALVGTHPSN